MLGIIWILASTLSVITGALLVSEVINKEKEINHLELLIFGLSMLLLIAIQPYIK